MKKAQRIQAAGKNTRPASITTIADRAPERIVFDLRWYHALFLFAALTFFCRAFLTGTALGLDDSFITYRFAFNNAQGHWFQWNVGEPPVYGTTTFLYTMLLTAVGFFGISIPIASVVISALAQTGAAYFAYLLVRRWCDDLAGLAAGILIAADGFGITATLGLETYLYLALLLGSLWCYQTERYTWAAILAALLGITRIDGFLLALVLTMHFLAVHKRFPMRALIAFVAVLLPWALASEELFGSLLPHTLAVKQFHGHLDQWGHYSLWNVRERLGILPLGMLLLASVYGLVRCVRLWRQSAAFLLGAFTALNVGLYYVVGLPNYSWYYAPTVAGAWFLAAGATFYVAKRLRIAVILLLCATVLLVNIRLFLRDPFGNNASGSIHMQAANWLRAHAKADESVVAMEVGTIGFYNPRLKIHDLLGLVSPEMFPKLATGKIAESVAAWDADFLFLADNHAFTWAVFQPQLWFQANRQRLSHEDPQWVEKWDGWYDEHYSAVRRWPLGNNWWNGQPAYYVLAQKKTTP
jgi:hypothetical protein